MRSMAQRALLSAVLLLALLPVTLIRAMPQAQADVGDPLPCPLTTQHPDTAPDDPSGLDPLFPDPIETAVLWPDGSGVIVPGRGVWSPDGDRAVIGLPLDRAQASDGFTPTVASWDGSDPTVLALPPHPANRSRTYQVAWAPDSQRVAVSYVEGNDPAVTAVFDRSGALLATLDAELLAWSPTGTHLAGTTAGDAVLVDVAAAPSTLVASGLGALPTSLDWSSDGTWLAAITGGPAPSASVVRNDGTGMQVLGPAVSDASWRPGTHELAWVPAATAATGGLSIHDADAGTDRTVTVPLATSAGLPRWSPDGSRLAFAGGGQVWILPAADDGTLAQSLGPAAVEGETGSAISHLAWAPAGGRLAYVVVRTGLGGELDWSTVTDAGAIDPDDPTASQPRRVTSDFVTPNGAGQRRVVALRWARDGTQLALDVDVESPIWPWQSSHTIVLAGDLDAPAPGSTSTFPSYPCGDGNVSATAMTPAVPMPPPTPRAPIASTVELTSTDVTLRWLVPWAPITGMRTGWQVRRSDDATVVDIPNADRATTTVPKGAPGTIVTFEVRAVGAGGTSAWVAFPPVTMPATRTLTGVVTGAGQPVGGATVRLQNATSVTSDDLTTTTATDGSWSLGPVEVQADGALVVEDPTGTFVTQHLAGIALPSRDSTRFPVELSPAAVDADGVGAPVQLHGTPQRTAELPNRNASPDALSFAVSTDQEVALLDAHGRLRVRVLDRPGADGVCSAGADVAVNRGDRVDFVTTSASRTTIRSTNLPTPTNGDLGCILADAYVVLPGEGAQPSSLAKVTPTGLVVPRSLPAGFDRITGSGRIVVWGPGGVQLHTFDTFVAQHPGPVDGFGADDEVAVTDAPDTAWSSSGWRLDLTTGTTERVVDQVAPAVDAAPTRGLLLLPTSLHDVGAGAPIVDLGGTVAGAFATNEQRLLLVDGDGTARLVAAPRVQRTVVGTVTSDGASVDGATVTLTGADPGVEHQVTTGADGTFTLTDVPAGRQHALSVTPPDGSAVPQTLTGMDLIEPPTDPLDVDLAATSTDPHVAPVSVPLHGEVVRMASITGDSPHAGGVAISTTDEVAVLDDRGRLRLRVLDRTGVDGVAVGPEHLVIGRPGRVDIVRTAAPWTVVTTRQPTLPHLDVAAFGARGYTLFGSSGAPALASLDAQDGRISSYDHLAGAQRITGIGDHRGGTGAHLLLWDDGTVQTRRAPLAPWSEDQSEPLVPLWSEGPGFGTDEEVVGSSALGRAWSSDGWSIDLATGERTQVFPTDGEHVALASDVGLLARDGAVFDLDGGDPLLELPATGPAAFVGDGARIAVAVAGPGGIVEIVPVPPLPPSTPVPGTGTPTDDGVRLEWDDPSPVRAPVTTWQIARDDSDAVVEVPGSDRHAVLPWGLPDAAVTFSIRALGPGGTSPWASFEPITRSDFAPTAPTPIRIVPRSDAVFLEWSRSSPTTPVTAWEVARDDTDEVVVVAGTEWFAYVSWNQPGSTVTFSIRAVGPGGSSSWVAFEPFTRWDFSDVPLTHTFWFEIDDARRRGLVDGYPDGSFRPGLAVSRQAAVTFLWRAAGSPTGRPDPGFSDVGIDHPFRDAIAWAADAGITTGYPDGTFRGGAPVTRQAWAAFLWRADGEPAVDPGCEHPGFGDVGVDHPFHDAITWAACADITTGYPDGTFRPTATATRQAAAATLVRAS